MLLTPLGPIKLVVNETEVEFEAVRYIKDHRCSDVKARYLIRYYYRKAIGVQRIRCYLPLEDIEGDIESGERLEAISFYQGFTKLTIGIELSIGQEEEYGQDYSGQYLCNGIEYETNPSTASQFFLFGVCWMRPFTEENEHQTWYGADPTLM